MFDTCYTNNESCFSFDNAACETLRTNKGRRSLVSRDRRSCKGGDDSFAKNFVSSCDNVPARAALLTRRYFHVRAQWAVCNLLVHAAWNLTDRVITRATREAARNCMSKLAAAVNPPVVWLPVCADDVAVKDSAAYTQCETGSLPARMEDREGWWHTACVYMTVYGPEKQELRECSYHAEAAKAAEPARKISLRPVVAAAVKGAAHAVRSARARKGWETRRRNAARQAEVLNATCEPLVVDADALPASVAYSATPAAELCHGRTAHGTDGRVVDAHVVVTHALYDVAGERWVNAPSTEGQWCDRGTIVTDGKDDVQMLVDHELRRVNTSRCPRVVPCEATETYPVRWDAPCLTPAEGRRERRNARRRELYRLRKAARLEKGRDENASDK